MEGDSALLGGSPISSVATVNNSQSLRFLEATIALQRHRHQVSYAGWVGLTMWLAGRVRKEGKEEKVWPDLHSVRFDCKKAARSAARTSVMSSATATSVFHQMDRSLDSSGEW